MCKRIWHSLTLHCVSTNQVITVVTCYMNYRSSVYRHWAYNISMNRRCWPLTFNVGVLWKKYNSISLIIISKGTCLVLIDIRSSLDMSITNGFLMFFFSFKSFRGHQWWMIYYLKNISRFYINIALSLILSSVYDFKDWNLKKCTLLWQVDKEKCSCQQFIVV